MLFSWPDRESLLTSQEIKAFSVLIPQINEKHIIMQGCHTSAHDVTLRAVLKFAATTTINVQYACYCVVCVWVSLQHAVKVNLSTLLK